MIIYYWVFFINFIFSIFDLGCRSILIKKVLLFFIGLLFVLFAGLRWSTGTDWDNYLYFYENIKYVEFANSGYELFFELLQRLSFYLFNNYTAMLLLTAIIIIILTYSVLIKFSPYPVLSVLMLYSYSINSSGFGYRQDLAIAFCFFSFKYIHDRNLLGFLICLIIAMFFHQSAFAFIFAYWFYGIKWNRRFFFILMITTLLMYIVSTKIGIISDYFGQNAAGKIDDYLDNRDKTFGDGSSPVVKIITGTFNRGFLLLLPIIIMYKKADSRILEIKKIYNLCLLGFLIFISLGSISIVFIRFARYYEMFQILLIPMTLAIVKPKNRIILFFIIFIYALTKISFVLLNDNKVYVPYQWIF